MKTIMLGTLLALVAATPAAAGTLTVDLTGVRGAVGKLYVSVQAREQFTKDRGTAGEVIAAPKPGAHRFSYDLPPGQYAVSVWHDDNGNGQFDKDKQHVPLDGWAMLNGDKLRAEPTFDQVKTVVGDGTASVSLAMTYGR